jgi:hypothetical protein
LQQLHARIETALMRNGMARIAGHVENAKLRPQVLSATAEFAAVHAGHDHVGEQQIDAR